MATIDKNKFTDLKKFLNEDRGNTQRLQTLKLPRDLNLGFSKQPKKVFVPNLNVVRNRDKPKEFNKSIEKAKDRPRDRRQKNKDTTPKFVQSSGIFSEGVGNDVVRSNRWGERRGDKENDGGAPTMAIPTIKKNSFQVDKKNEDSVLSKITGCDAESDDEKLPFQPISWKNKLEKPTLVKLEPDSDKIKIKIEEPEDDVTPGLKRLKLEPSYFSSVPQDFFEDKFSNDAPSISLWGLPDSFAGKGLSDDPNCKKLFDYCLSDMHEGQIGKIVIRQSGRMEICIGNMKYDLEPGESDSYREDIISIDNGNSERTDTALLGNIKNRYFLSPDWDRLLL